MLMISPRALAALRSETRVVVTLAGSAPKPAERFRKLSRHRRETIVEKLVGMMRTAEPTPFFMEGPGRAGIRSALCMQGWPWGQADAAAADVVETALGRVGATRPTWKQGQPEYTQDGALPIERERCIRCAKPLPKWHSKFCSLLCTRAYQQIHADRYDQEAYSARARAKRAALVERQPERECIGCGIAFKPKYPAQKYHSRQCSADATIRFYRRTMPMVCEAVRDDAK